MDIADRIRTALVERDDVRLVYLYGSNVAGTARRGSDVDIAILFDKVVAPAVLDVLSERLAGAVECSVDLVILNDAPPLLCREVLARGRLLLCRDDQDRVGFETRTTARYEDTAHLRRVQWSYLRERAEAHRAGAR